MKIHAFDLQKGFYKFEVDEIETQFHEHPTAEFIFFESGDLTVETSQNIYEGCRFVIIKPNVKHRIKTILN